MKILKKKVRLWNEKITSSYWRRKPIKHSFSIVSATYNAEPYIDDFMRSFASQTTGFENVEIIIIDDGSTDETATKVKSWIERFPNNIRYFHQENQGVSAARNAGLTHATGDWVTFTDPDDFVNAEYFSEVNREICKKHNLPLSLIAVNVLRYFEADDRIADTHSLKYRFKKRRTSLPVSNMGRHIHGQVATAFFRRDLIEKHNLRFDEKVKPGFEDSHFTNRFMILEQETSVTFLREAKYYYRIRSAGSSITNNMREDPRYYLDQLEYGVLDLANYAIAEIGNVPRSLQRMLMYETSWYFKYLTNHMERIAFLSLEEQAKFLSLISKVYHHIQPDVIESFSPPSLLEGYKVGLLNRYKNAQKSIPNVYVREFRAKSGELQFFYHSGGDELPIEVTVDGHVVEQFSPSKRTYEFMGDVFFVQHAFWVSANKNSKIDIKYQGKPVALKRWMHSIGLSGHVGLDKKLRLPKLKQPDVETSRLIEVSNQYSNPQMYDGSWLFMDREDRANDSAEHLYRFVQKTNDAQNIFFILDRSSKDWDRLVAEGFRMLEFGSDEHFLAMLGAEKVISSHFNGAYIWPFNKTLMSRTAKFKFVFLQHGVIYSDISDFLNTKPISLMVTSTQPEYDAITDQNSNYLLGQNNTILTGLPRHDGLYAMSKTDETILIIPTWRRSLTNTAPNVGPDKKLPEFSTSAFRKNWEAFLNSPRLNELAVKYGKKIVFCPHPNMEMYLDDINVPDYVSCWLPTDSRSLQEVFADTALVVSDYSSATFELAYLKVPAVYFQFDQDDFFSGQHTGKPDYFEFERDGFGPVETELEVTLDQIDKALMGQEDPKFEKRRMETFKFRDGGCCKRVYDAILAME